jgi:phage tail-like protein
MTANTRPLAFIDYLPEVFRPADQNGHFLTLFLKAFESEFEKLQQEIEGKPDHSAGGIPDLFDPKSTPPADFANREGAGAADFAFLAYLASWVALPLRPDKLSSWNRVFFAAAIGLAFKRGTVPGLDGLLRAWLKGDVVDRPMVSDFAPATNGAGTGFQLGVRATLGIDTVLGAGPPSLFIADLIVDWSVPATLTPSGLDLLQRTARLLLDAEKPAHTSYRLTVSGPPMQLAAPGQTDIDGTPAARIGVTTLLWQEPWVFFSG